MENRSLYENLDTSFVNLSALVGFLRRRGEPVTVRLEMNDYRAEIRIGADNRMVAGERCARTGFSASGTEALQRILIRAREPGGAIHVYQTKEQTKPHAGAEDKDGKSAAGEDWPALLAVLGELTEAVELAFADGGIDFAAGFARARRASAIDYPFLPALVYADGRFADGGPVPPRKAKIFAAGVLQALGLLLEKLRHDAEAAVYRCAAQRMLAVAHRRRPICDRFFITPALMKMLGV